MTCSNLKERPCPGTVTGLASALPKRLLLMRLRRQYYRTIGTSRLFEAPAISACAPTRARYDLRLRTNAAKRTDWPAKSSVYFRKRLEKPVASRLNIR